jgi:hypothetical protein
MSIRNGVDEDRLVGQVSGSLDGRYHEGIGTVDREVHVKQAHGIVDHAGRKVVFHCDRRSQSRQRIVDGIPPTIDHEVSDVFTRCPQFVQIAAHESGVGDVQSRHIRVWPRRY